MTDYKPLFPSFNANLGVTPNFHNALLLIFGSITPKFAVAPKNCETIRKQNRDKNLNFVSQLDTAIIWQNWVKL